MGAAPFPLEPPRSEGVDSKLTALAVALAGMGVVEMPVLIAHAIAGLVRLPNLEARSDKDIWILYHRDFKRTARVRIFVADLRRQFDTLKAPASPALLPLG